MKKNGRKQHKGYNYHHLKPRSRGGQSIDSNMCFLKIGRHAALHRLFGNSTPSQIIKMLKGFEWDMLILFGTTDTKEAAKMFERLMQMKERNWYEDD